MHRIEQIIYVADPMCSWCWGFAPELSRLRAHLESHVSFSLCMGNLRNGHIWNDSFKTFLRSHWQQVAQQTGQSFNMQLFSRETFNYTTEPACRAVCTGREIDASLAFTLFESLQQAFYRDGLDITDTRTIALIAENTGYPPLLFAERFRSERMRAQVLSDKNRAGTYGASVFPSLVIIDKEGHLSVIRGYRTFESLKRLLHL